MTVPICGNNLLRVFVDTGDLPLRNFGVESDDTLLCADGECLDVLAPLDEATLVFAG